MSRRGPALRARREALGLSREDLSRRTRIPLAHLVALEEGREHELPEGPYAAAYQRALERELGLEIEEPPREDTGAIARTGAPLPLWAVRAVALGSVCVLLGLVGWQAWSRYAAFAERAAQAPAAVADQVVSVTARRNAHLTVRVDGERVLDRAVAGGESLTFHAHHRVELEIPAAEPFRIEYNGRAIVPQGRQDAPRKLVFVDDLAPQPPEVR